MRYPRLLIAGLLIAGSIAVAGPARATEMTAEEVADLAEVAAHDEDARDRLEEVDRIDGRPVDMRRLLQDAEGEEVVERVRALVGSSASLPPADGSAREEAREILSDRRFRPPPIPRPFRSIVERIADVIEPIVNAIGNFFGWIARGFSAIAGGTPGGAIGLWLLIAAIVLTITIIRTRSAVATRARSRTKAATSRDARDDPKRLEILAAEAEERGEHDVAVRLRFRAGLLRLGAAKVIPRRPSMTTGELRRLLASPDFDRLGIAFDEIAYGGRSAVADDAADARTVWAQLLKEKVSR